MERISEANMSTAMKFAFEYFIAPHDPDGILDYRPKSQNDPFLRDNPTTGIIFLKKHPEAKVAWVLTKFEQSTEKKYGQHVISHDNVKISNVEEFKDFFGVAPGPNFVFPDDMTIYVKWNKEKVVNKNANRDFDEYTPNFYMYTNHLKVNLNRLVKRLLRINQIIETNPKAIINGQFNIPYSATDIK